MTDVIAGMKKFFETLESMPIRDRHAYAKNLNAHLKDVFVYSTALLLDSVDEDYKDSSIFSDEPVLSQEGCEILLHGMEEAEEQMEGNPYDCGLHSRLCEVDRYLTDKNLCGECLNELSDEYFTFEYEPEEYAGRKVYRKVETGYSCPHCGYKEEY